MAAPYTTPIPGSALYEQAALAANTAYQKALAQLNQQRTGLLRSYGYLGDINPTSGVVQNVRVDPNNPYGEFEQLLRSSALASDAAANDAEARGLHGGLAHKAESNVRYEHGRQSAALGSALANALGSLQGQQNDAINVRDAALYQAEQDAARAAIEQMAQDGYVNPADVGPSGIEPLPAEPLGDGGAGQGDAPLLGPDQPVATNITRTPVNQITRAPAPKASAPTRYYTYKKDVPLKRGQKLHFKPGKGYYAA